MTTPANLVASMMGLNNYLINISSNTANFSLIAELSARGWSGIGAVSVRVNIAPGVVVYGTGGGAGFSTGTLPSGSIVRIFNNGIITGAGGHGGNAGGTLPTVGGTGLVAASPIYIDNTGGVIAGGGGGGGGLGNSTDGGFVAGGGGGGGGSGFGLGGIGSGGGGGGSAGGTGAGGTALGGGAAGSGGIPGTGYPGGHTGYGGGGQWVAGNSETTNGIGGGGGNWTGTYTVAGQAGANPGACVVGSGNINWLAVGTRYGSLS